MVKTQESPFNDVKFSFLHKYITQGPVSSKSEVTLIHIGEPLSEAEVLQILDSIKYDSRGVIEIDKLVDIIFDV